MIAASQIARWLNSIPSDTLIWIDEGGLTLCTEGGACLEIGGEAHEDIDTVILAAAEMNDMDDAVRHVQDFMGVTDGGFAGVYFSGKPPFDGFDDWTEAWPHVSHEGRMQALTGYHAAQYVEIEEIEGRTRRAAGRPDFHDEPETPAQP